MLESFFSFPEFLCAIPFENVAENQNMFKVKHDSYLTQTLLFGSTSFDSETNTLVLNATIDTMALRGHVTQLIFFATLIKFLLRKNVFLLR